jgi:hypothetical protein
LTGCSTPNAPLPDERPEEYANTPNPTTTQVEECTDLSENTTKATENIDDKKDAWLTYAEKYETEHLFEDLYIPEKCWLIGNENIVEIISLGDIDNVTAINQSSVERVEHSNVMNFSNITVFDKTGKSISIMVSPEEFEMLMKLVDK